MIRKIFERVPYEVELIICDFLKDKENYEKVIQEIKKFPKYIRTENKVSSFNYNNIIIIYIEDEIYENKNRIKNMYKKIMNYSPDKKQ